VTRILAELAAALELELELAAPEPAARVVPVAADKK
jgi:hypothetical protein